MIYIGRYKETKNNDKYPSLKESVRVLPSEQKKAILSYLRNEKYIRAAIPAVSRDYFTNAHFNEKCLLYSDGEYCWDYNVIYYFEKYNIDLGDAFTNHVLKRGI